MTISAKKMEVAMDAMGDAVVWTDRSGQVEWCNRFFENLVGATRSEILGQDLTTLFPLDSEENGTLDAESHPIRLTRVEGYHSGIYTYPPDTGQLVLEISGTLIEPGRHEAVLVVRDITERRWAEIELREREERYRLLAESSTDIITKLTLDGTMTYVSPASEAILGYPPSELEGRRVSDLIHPDDEQRMASALEQLKTESGLLTLEARLQRRDGSYLWAEATTRILTSEDGEMEIIAVTRDVTGRKEAREQLRRYADALQARNRELQDFAYVASHDLQEPLRKIQAFSTLLARRFADSLPEGGHEYLDRMKATAGRMQVLIEDLLAFSRVTTRARPFEKVDLSTLLDEIAEDFDLLIEEKDATLEWGELPVVEGDPSQLRQVFHHLVGNALKFHREGVPPVIKITGRLEDHSGASGHVWRIQVEDNGIGIDPQDQERIFDVFERLHGRSEYGGTGMGLAIVRKIMERHHGRIEVESSHGQGSKFFVTLPQEIPAAENQQPAALEAK